ncbi:hypothetical protein K1T71_001639 [Dendrolimus kikuchii]|uniref:Uncharacterized protein n=1 Tax=Dendrolimus kikuchii TaxID=765133 RepID=A0ACC1DEM5_9NEOP|nr:hypothetical protein K1T71_001639 [Dendrolimus kikuchii]
MCDTIQNCCRICLDVNSDHVLVLGDPNISLQMKSCLSITVSANDYLPKSICVSCASQLHQFYSFQLNARISQDWLESCLNEKSKKGNETKMVIHPLPDSEYNSDSLLEFLNNTENIEEYLNNLGKEDIPSIVNMLDKNEHVTEFGRITAKLIKTSPKKKEKLKSNKIKMDIDVFESDIKVVKGIILKETDQRDKVNNVKVEKNFSTCFGCNIKFDCIQTLSRHISTCDNALRTCIQCGMMFDSKQKLQQHTISHNNLLPMLCNCGEKFFSKELWIQHVRTCQNNFTSAAGFAHRCTKCGEIFKHRFELYKHAREHVMKAEERFCDICGHIFIGDEALANHRKSEHEKFENNVYSLPTLAWPRQHGHHYSMRGPLHTSHVQKHMKTPTVSHLCETCGQSFVSKTSLLRHSLQHCTKNVCKICNIVFDSRKSLEEHIKVHDEMVMCERCGQTVTNLKLDEHVCV